MGIWFKFMQDNANIHQKISDTIQETVSSTPSSTESAYTIKVDTQVSTIMSQANTMSNQFMKLAGICTTLENAIVNPPPISSNESS